MEHLPHSGSAFSSECPIWKGCLHLKGEQYFLHEQVTVFFLLCFSCTLPAQAAAAPHQPGSTALAGCRLAQTAQPAAAHPSHTKGPHAAQWEPHNTSSSPHTACCPAQRWQTTLLQSPPQAERRVLPEGSTASATAAMVLLATSMGSLNTVVLWQERQPFSSCRAAAVGRAALICVMQAWCRKGAWGWAPPTALSPRPGLVTPGAAPD